MANQSKHKMPFDSGLVLPSPQPGSELLGDALEKRLEEYNLCSLNVPMGSIVGSADLTFRQNVEAPELSDNDTDSDGQPQTPPEIDPEIWALNKTLKSVDVLDERNIVIGGATVHNLCLVIPDQEMQGFADLPVQPLMASKGQTASLIALKLDDQDEKPPVPLIVLPDEVADISGNPAVPMAKSSKEEMERFTDTIELSPSTLKTGSLDVIKSDESSNEKSTTDQVGKADMNEFVLSGDIDNFWGIKGLTVKLYKYKGPEKPKNEAREEKKAAVDDGKDDKEKEDETEGPAREKIKLNPKSVAFKGKPLGTMFPFVNDETFKNLPVENLEITYSEEETNWLFKPGMRLELNVPFKEALAWVGDALKTLFGPKDAPASIHLSARLSDSRDWSKAPKIQNLILQGYFPALTLTAWDCLNFKTLGIEITATKATKGKTSKGKGSSGKERSDKKSNERSPEDVRSNKEDTQKADTSVQGSADEGTENQANDENENDDKDGKEPDDKPKEKQGWNFGFAFFGTLLVTNIPHANAPLTMDYRMARDFVASEDDEDEGEKTEESQSEEGNGKKEEGGIDGAEMEKGIEKKKSKKVNDGQKEKSKKDKEAAKKKASGHKRCWNLVVKADKWKDIYGIENVTMDKAELKTSFNEGDFRGTAVLRLSADLKLGDGDFKVKGQVSRNDNHIEAEVGDLTLTEIRKIHAQIAGQKLPDRKALTDEEKKVAAGNEVTFKELKLSLSSKKIKEKKTTRRALEFSGKVTFNEHSSATAHLVFASEGLTITGGISDFKIPETEITVKRAGLEIFFAFKTKYEKALDEGADDSKDKDKDIDGDGDETKSATDTDDKAMVKEGKEKSLEETSLEKKTKKAKRESRFAVLGIVEINKITIKVGFYISQKKDSKKREWLAFGAIENIRLREAWDKIPEDSFLNLQLEKVALIASSETRKKKKKDVTKDDASADGGETQAKTLTEGTSDAETWDKSLGEAKTTDDNTKNESKGNGDESKSEENKSQDVEDSANWDVLGTVDAYNYPIVKGVQLCATISSFEQLEELNGKKRIDGLTLIISITDKGKISVRIDLPESFRVDLSDAAYLSEFGTSIGIGRSGPELELRSTLTMLFKDSDPISVEGLIYGSLKDAHGDLKMSAGSKWINPFNLNKKLIFTDLGVSAGFTYATVLLTGPDQIFLKGKAEIGNFHASIDMGLRVTSAEAVLHLEMSELNTRQIIQVTGTLSNNLLMQQTVCPDNLIVFRDIDLYLSSGAEFLGDYYERGIIVKGKMEAFGKKGEFDGKFDDDGVVVKAGIDNFKLGGLEVTSTRKGVDRATMDIEITKEKQKVFIDGMVRYYDFEMSIFLDLDIQEQQLKADIKVQFTDTLYIALKASSSIPDDKSLEGVDMSLEATLEPDIFGSILQGISDGIDHLQKVADQVENVRNDLTSQLGQKKVALAKLAEDLKRLKGQALQETLAKQTLIGQENDKLTELDNKLQKYKDALKQAEGDQSRNEKDIAAQRQLMQAAQRELDAKVGEMKLEYEQKIEQEVANQERWEEEKQTLITSRDASWGDALRSYKAADSSWNWWDGIVNDKYQWKCTCEKKLDNCYWWEKGYWAVKLAEASAGLEDAKARQAIDAELLHAAQAVMNTEAFKSMEQSINDAAREIDRFGRAIDGLIAKGPMGYVEEMCTDQRTKLNRQIEIFDKLIAKSKELQRACDAARRDLEQTKGRLSPEQKQARLKIAVLEGEIKVLPAQLEYDDKKKDYDNIELQVNLLVTKLDNLSDFIKDVQTSAKNIVNTLKKAIPRVTKIVVKATTKALVEDEPLVFEIQAEWMEQYGTFHIEWAPNQDVSDLYSEAARKLATWNKDIKSLPAPKAVPKTPASTPKLYLLHQGGSSDRHQPWWNKFDGKTWTGDTKISAEGLRIRDGFCTTSFRGKLYVFHRHPATTPSIPWYKTYEGDSWSKGTTICIPNMISLWGMSAITFMDKLYLFHHGPQKIHYNIFDGILWQGDVEAPVPEVKWGFAVVVFNGKIYLFYRELYNQPYRIWYITFDSTRWSEKQQVPSTGTDWGITAAVYGEKIYLVHHGVPDSGQVWYNVFDGKDWDGDKRISDCQPSGELSSIAFEDRIFLFCQAKDSSDMCAYVFDGKGWQKEELAGVKTSEGLACAVY